MVTPVLIEIVGPELMVGLMTGQHVERTDLGHAVASGLAGLVLAVTGSFMPVLALSMAFSAAGVVVILRLESSARVLIPHWEEGLPPEARAMPMGPAPVAKQ
jgi:hypothetical protein